MIGFEENFPKKALRGGLLSATFLRRIQLGSTEVLGKYTRSNI